MQKILNYMDYMLQGNLYPIVIIILILLLIISFIALIYNIKQLSKYDLKEYNTNENHRANYYAFKHSKGLETLKNIIDQK